MSHKDKIRIAELEAKCYIYEVALQAAGLKPLQEPPKPKDEIGFVLKRKEKK